MQHRVLDLQEESGQFEHRPVTQLSFKPFLDYVRARLQDEQSIKKDIYQLILQKFANYPELEDVVSIEDMARYKELLNLLYVVLSTVVEDETKVLWGLSVPVSPAIFFGSDALYNFMLEAGNKSLNCELFKDVQSLKRQKTEMLYSFLLEKFYDFGVNKRGEIIRPVFDRESNLLRYYRINIDTRFVEVSTTGDLPELNLETLQVHLHEQAGLDVLQRVLPLSLFSFTGFSIITITDVTPEYATEQIKDLLVNSHGKADEDTYRPVIQSLKSLVGTDDIEFSLLPLYRVNDKLVQDLDAYCHSVIFSLGKQQGVMKNFFIPMIEKFIANPRIIYFRDLDQSGPNSQRLSELLRAASLKSYALMPVYYNNKLVGSFEMYTKKKGLLDERAFSRIDPAMALLAQLMQNRVEEFEARITDTIRDKFTSLQPAVQWKFNEAAWEYIYESRDDAKPATLKKIEFKNVYPLYGAVDMRNSTIERNNAVQADLKYQFRLLRDVLTKLRDESKFALADEFLFKCAKWNASVDDMLTTNEEIRLNGYLNEEAHPFLRHFRNTNPVLEPIIDTYFEAINPASGEAWKHRRQLEESMQLINNAVNNYLDMMNVELQQAYPCYFEKFRTDGIEYDLYIGQSITPNRTFDPVYLKNLRLWQLGSMAAIAKLSNVLLPQMKVKLETTQLIFIYSNTIDISFRNDERRFDVEGGYNIRYHIIKKRIDKVHVLNTGERLTQPGKIALIYFDTKDADEYLSYISHLQAKGVLLNDLEHLELEELQGVSGLKAIRIGVDTGRNLKEQQAPALTTNSETVKL